MNVCICIMRCMDVCMHLYNVRYYAHVSVCIHMCICIMRCMCIYVMRCMHLYNAMYYAHVSVCIDMHIYCVYVWIHYRKCTMLQRKYGVCVYRYVYICVGVCNMFFNLHKWDHILLIVYLCFCVERFMTEWAC